MLLGVTPEEVAQSVARIATTGITHSMIVMDGQTVIGGGIGNIIDVNRTNLPEPKIREDYGECRFLPCWHLHLNLFQ